MPFDFIPPRRLVDLTIGSAPITPGSTLARLYDATIGAPSVAPLFGLSIYGVPSNANVGDAPSFAPTIAGGTPNYTLSLLSGSLPPGRSISGLAVVGAYTTAGSYAYTLRVTDSLGATADLPVSLVVSAAGASLAISGTPGAATVGSAYSFTPTVTGGSGTKSFTLTGSLPGGLSFSSSTGAITGTPTTAGTTSGLSIQVSDSSGSATLGGLSIAVQASGGGPLAIAGVMPNAIVGQAFSWAPTITGGTQPYSVARSGFAGITGSYDPLTGTFSGPFSATATYNSGSLVVTDSKGAQATLSNLTFSVYAALSTDKRFIGVGNSLVALSSNSQGSYGASGPDGTATETKNVTFAAGPMSAWMKGFNHAIRPHNRWVYGVAGSSSLLSLDALNNSTCLSTGNPAASTTTANDASYWVLNSGEYSPVSNPAGTWLLTAFDNDFGLSPPTSGDARWANQENPSIQTAMAILETAGQNGKRVVLSNCHPRGNMLAVSRNLTVNTTTGQATAAAGDIGTNGVNYLAEAADIGASPYGPLVIANGGGGSAIPVGTHLIKVAPGTTLTSGRYSVQAGTYSTFVADNITTLAVSFSAIAQQRGTGTGATKRYKQFVNWALSSAPNFVDPDSGFNFGVPGCKYKYPHVTVVDHFTSFVDSTTGAAFDSKIGVSFDGFHLASRGAELARAAAAAVNPFTSWPSQIKTAAANNKGTFFTGGSTTGGGTLPAAMRDQTKGLVIRGDGASYVCPANSSTFTPSGNLTAGSVVWSTGVVSLTFASATTSGALFDAVQDQTSFVNNPLLDINHGTGASFGFPTASAVPAPWSLKTPGAAPPGITLTNVLGTDSKGRPAFVITAQGQLLTGTQYYIELAQVLSSFYKRIGYALSGEIMAQCSVEISKGPNGHLLGLSAPRLNLAFRSNPLPRVGRNTSTGGSQTLNAYQFTSEIDTKYGGSFMTDLDLVEGATGGIIAYDMLSPTIDVTSMTQLDAVSNFALDIDFVPYSDVDFTLKVSNFNLIQAP